MTDDMALHRVERLAWDHVAARIAGGAPAILPIGAAAKEHGFHLPMNTDRVQAEWLAGALARQLDGLIWPTLAYGYYPAFTAYAGSCSLSEATFEAVVQDVTAGLIGFGCRTIFVLDTGISTLAPVGRVLARLDHRNVLHLRVHDGPAYRRAAEVLSEQGHGSHADELETSIMLALAPHLVDMSRAEASPARVPADGPLTPTDLSSLNYSRSGSYGDPTLASIEKGNILLAAMVDDLIDQATAFMATLSTSGVVAPHVGQQRSASQ
jgi:creatinine amidohydrolase